MDLLFDDERDMLGQVKRFDQNDTNQLDPSKDKEQLFSIGDAFLDLIEAVLVLQLLYIEHIILNKAGDLEDLIIIHGVSVFIIERHYYKYIKNQGL